MASQRSEIDIAAAKVVVRDPPERTAGYLQAVRRGW